MLLAGAVYGPVVVALALLAVYGRCVIRARYSWLQPNALESKSRFAQGHFRSAVHRGHRQAWRWLPAGHRW